MSAFRSRPSQENEEEHIPPTPRMGTTKWGCVRMFSSHSPGQYRRSIKLITGSKMPPMLAAEMVRRVDTHSRRAKA